MNARTDTACVRDSPNGIIGKFTNGTIGNERTLNVSRQPMVPLVPMLSLVETLIPMVPLVVPMVPMVPLVVPMVPLVSPTVLRVFKVLPMVPMVYQYGSRFYQWYHW